MLFRLTLLLISIFSLASCGESIPAKELAAKGITVLNKNERANVILYREAKALSGGVRVTYDNQIAGYLYDGTHIPMTLSEGRHNFTVDLPATLGKCDIFIDVNSNEIIFLEVKQKSAVASLLFGGIIGSEIGSAIESGRTSCTGSFYINRVSSDTGNTAISKTKISTFAD